MGATCPTSRAENRYRCATNQLRASRTTTRPSLGVGRGADQLQILLNAPVAGDADTPRVVEGLIVPRARLVVKDLGCEGVLVLCADVLVHHQGRQDRPNHGAAEGANLNLPAEALRATLRERQ